MVTLDTSVLVDLFLPVEEGRKVSLLYLLLL